MEKIINLCDFEIVLYRPDHPEVVFPAKAEAPVAAMLAAILLQRSTMIGQIHWSGLNKNVLPPPQEGVFYIVPLEFGTACPRSDLLTPFRGQFEPRGNSSAHRMNTRALVKVSDALPSPQHPVDLGKTQGCL